MPEEEDIMPVGSDTHLVAYRLGRVERAVEEVTTELKLMNQIGEKINLNSWKIQSLEASRTRLYQFMTGIATAVVILGLQVVLRLV